MQQYDKIDTLIPGFTKREAPRLTVDFISKLPDVLPDGTVVTPEQKAETVAAIADVGGFEAAAEVERQFTGIGRDLNLDPAQTKELRTKTEAFIAAGDNSPEAKAKFEAEIETIVVIGCRKPCAISDINDPKIKSLFGAVVVATEKVGGAFNRALPLTQKLIGYGLTALGGVKGVVEEVVLSVAPQGVQDAIGKAGEAITVGANALLRNESFGTIATQNENKSSNNPTFNQTTGIGLATSVVAIGGGVKVVGGKGKGGGADAPDVVGGNPNLAPEINTNVLGGVTVYDKFTKRTFTGNIDLTPTLDRIQNGGSFPHVRDGTVFKNKEGGLPAEGSGYYTEYVHLTPGVKGPRPQRLVVGKGGEVYYSPDHYKTFIKVKSGK